MTKKVLSPEEKAQRRKARKISNLVMVVMCILSLLMVGLFAFNMINIGTKEAPAAGETLALDTHNVMKNDLYEIGNNPTDYQRQLFEELTQSINDGEELSIATNVVKNFIADFFTWTNKDGNYEVGGLMYIYGPKYSVFQEEMRWTFYSDLDLYIAQYGRENLLEVTDIEVLNENYAADYEVNGETYKAFYIETTWDYKPTSKIDTDDFQNTGYFTVVDNNGRYEIVRMFDSWD